MTLHNMFFIPIADLTLTHSKDANGNDGGPVFPNNEIGNFQTHTFQHPRASFVWNGVSEMLTVSDNASDGTFDDDLDGIAGYRQELPADWNGFKAGSLVETQYSYDVQDPSGTKITVYAVYIESPLGDDHVFGIVSSAPLKPGVSYTIYDHHEIADVAYSSIYICFASGTAIRTPEGERVIEALAAGDTVVTRDNGVQTIRWIGQRRLDAADLAAAPHLQPIRIRAGALGEGLPATDLVVSPQHRILVRSRIAQRMFGTDEVLVAAKQLVEIDGIEVAQDMQDVTYHHMLFDRHEIVFANGTEAESLYTGPEALKAVGPAARAEILEIFPELADDGFEAEPARTLARGRQSRTLAQRHARNGVALVSTH